MIQSIERFLEFNGRTLLFLAKNGIYWIAIKPVCEAIGVEYTRVFKNIKGDPVLGPALAIQPMQVPGNQVRNMTCLPEYLVYGWLFSIQSDSKGLLDYKIKCYEVLFNHFHGSMTSRKKLIGRKANVRQQLAVLESSLRSNEEFKSWENLKAEEARIGKALKEIDLIDLNEQLKLFNQ